MTRTLPKAAEGCTGLPLEVTYGPNLIRNWVGVGENTHARTTSRIPPSLVTVATGSQVWPGVVQEVSLQQMSTHTP